MKRSRSRVIVGVGVLCFVGVMAVWLTSSGDRAIADADKAAITKTATQEMTQMVALEGRTDSLLAFQAEGVVQHLSVFLNITSANARSLKVFMTSPTGTRVLVVDGARSQAAKADRLEGWFGGEGLATEESLAAFAGEPVAGKWKLTVEGARGQLTKWAVTADLSSSTKMAGMETYGEYGDGGGCDCRVSSSNLTGVGLSLLLLLGLVLLRRP